MSHNYWTSIEEKEQGLNNLDTFKDEIPHNKSVQQLIQDDMSNKSSSRRDFLKWCGFTFASTAIATSCESPVKKAIPYLNKPEEITPGKANYYASSFFDGSEYASVLVKTREGRPIKIEPNDLSGVTKGGSSARVQASVLSLYDHDNRYHHPVKEGKKATWDEVDNDIKQALQDATASEKEIALVTPNIINPATNKLISEFSEKYPTVNWIQYDPISASAMLDANKTSFGTRVIPSYHFDNAEVIVGINADFLGTWLLPVDYTDQYVQNRKLEDGEKTMSRHIQIESMMTLTGTNADERLRIKPSEEGKVLVALYNELAGKVGKPTMQKADAPIDVSAIADELYNNRKKSLLVCGTNNYHHQLIVNAINHLLDSYGKTIDLTAPLQVKQADDKAMRDFVSRLEKGNVSMSLFYDVDPLYDYPDANQLAKALEKTDLAATLATNSSQTSQSTNYVCALNHYLESWGDAEPVKGKYSLAQPTIRKLYDTRQFEEMLLTWMGKENDFHKYLKNYWEKAFYPNQNQYEGFRNFWTHTLQDGIYEPEQTDNQAQPGYSEKGLASSIQKAAKKKPSEGSELMLYEKVGIGNGKHANNPWLQELPDPVTKATWDNYLCVPPAYAKQKGIENEDVVEIEGVKIPVLVQPGMADNVVAIAVGYGKKDSGKAAKDVGINAFPFIGYSDGYKKYHHENISINKTTEKHTLALTQSHHRMEGREIVKETNLETFVNDPKSIKQKDHDTTLYKEREFEGHHWALVVDLNACTGCGACAIACQSENNIPVVGKEEVVKKRIMHWIRLDRYYKDDEDNPQVVHQPVMCQHCDNAPCENVCPVAATTHSNEGLNQMSYNRCIGTKYCINNCPYKVRRFNWYKYAGNDKYGFNSAGEKGQMELNPDVTVRSRGVVEKCSFCVQRIQEKKEQAKLENRQLEDGEITPACAQACPANALIFGDLNDPNSRVSQMLKSNRNYHLLEELHTKPSVSYMTKVRNMGAKIEA